MVVKRIVTAEQAKEIDRYSIEELGMPGIVLMERAALCFVRRVQEKITKEQKLLVVCGSGNNGGDGMAAARMLHHLGYSCEVYLAGKVEKMTQSAKIQWNLLKNLGVPIVNVFAPKKDVVLIDALFGVGLSRPITGEYAKLIRKMNQFRCFAVDLPSGVNADTGCPMAVSDDGTMTAVKAEMTVSFGFVKAGLILGTGRVYAGEVFTEDIGFPLPAQKQCKDAFFYLEPSDESRLLPQRESVDNKGSRGRVLVFAGSETMLGAAFFSGMAAYRTGTGLVEMITCEKNIPVLAQMLPSAIYFPMEKLFPKEENHMTCCKGLLEEKIKMASCVILGPGLGRKKRAVCMTKAVLCCCAEQEKKLVMDADALNILSEREEWYRFLTINMVLTPHLKEMSRLCKKTVEEIKEDMITTAKHFAASHQNVTLVLKDSRSVITNGDKCYINMSGNHGMAVAGSGDVLSGILGGILAQAEKKENGSQTGMVTLMAALGAYLHGRAGDEARRKKNAYSLMAEDIIEGLSEVLKEG